MLVRLETRQRQCATRVRLQFPCLSASSFVYSSAVKLISWNVNGLRAVLRKNFLEYLESENPDVLCLQEIKCGEDDIDQLWPAHYTAFWNCAEKKGYSGTAIFVKKRPVNVAPHIGIVEHDKEGRVLTAELDDFFVVNVYVPNSKRDLSRLPYRQRWDKDFLGYLKKSREEKARDFLRRPERGAHGNRFGESEIERSQPRFHAGGTRRIHTHRRKRGSSTPFVNLKKAADITRGGAS